MSRPKRQAGRRRVKLQALRGDEWDRGSKEIKARVESGGALEFALPPLPCDCEAVQATLSRLLALKWGE
jgi:hypothetical protein